MGNVIASLSVSLDGYFTGPNPGPTQASAKAARCSTPG